jgi:hypothetical protein
MTGVAEEVAGVKTTVLVLKGAAGLIIHSSFFVGHLTLTLIKEAGMIIIINSSWSDYWSNC